MMTCFKKNNCLSALAICSMLLATVACSKKQDTDNATTVSSSAATEVDDTYLTSKVHEALLADAGIKSFAIKVATEKGEVVLSGFVNNQQQIDQSIALTKSVKGVKVVINQLSVKDSTTSANNNISDGLVTATVKTALLNDERLRSFDVSVVTRNGEVMLSGIVDNQAQSERTVQVAQSVEGVKSVLNHMVIK